MKLRQLALFSLALLMALACFGGTSAKAEREGTHGNLSWNLSADGTLTITAMDPNAWVFNLADGGKSITFGYARGTVLILR